MKAIIEIEIKSLNDSNLIESSASNKIFNDVIHKITKAINDTDTSKVYFNIKIDTRK